MKNRTNGGNKSITEALGRLTGLLESVSHDRLSSKDGLDATTHLK